MAYIGNIPAEQFTSVDIQNFSVSATANYTLDRPVANENEIELFINNVRQHPGSGKAYTASGTALTLSEATAGTDTMYCVYQGKARQTVTPATSSVTNAMLAGSIDLTSKVTGALPQANIADQAINEAKMQVSNSPVNGYMLTAQSGNTGGLTWAEAPSGGFVRVGGQSTHTNAGGYYIDNVFSNTYKTYRIVGTMMQDDTSGNIYSKLRSWDGSSGGNLSTSVYCCSTMSGARNASGGTSITGSFANNWNNSYFEVTQDSYNDRSSNRYAVHIDWYFYRPDSTAYSAAPYIVGSTGYWEYNGGADRFRTMQFTMAYMDSVSPAGISFYPSSGNMSMIDINIYGMVAS